VPLPLTGIVQGLLMSLMNDGKASGPLRHRHAIERWRGLRSPSGVGHGLANSTTLVVRPAELPRRGRMSFGVIS